MWSEAARVNKKFMNNLANMYGQEEFTSKQAEDLYVAKHERVMPWHGPDHDHEWAKSNARQNLSIATERGILIRVRKGTYKFNK